MEQGLLQYGVLGICVLALGIFAWMVINRMFKREDLNHEERKTVIENNTKAIETSTAAWKSCEQRLGQVEQAVNRIPGVRT